MVSRQPLFPRLAAFCGCAGLAFFLGSALAQPSGLTPVHGSATVARSGAKTTITTANGAGTRHSALDWRSFQVPRGQTVFFAQPDASSTSINRVTGGDPSTIAGTLASNGRLVLVNPAGIAVAPGAVVDTAGFTASTLDLDRLDAMAGRQRFGSDAKGRPRKDGRDGGDDDDDDRGGGKSGPLQADGHIVARGGDLVLVGKDLRIGKDAQLDVRDGDLILAAGSKAEITGPGLEGIRMELRARDGEVVNFGTLRGDSVAIFARRLRHSGLVQAHAATDRGGKVVLHATGDADLRGGIEATAGSRGGAVHVIAPRLALRSGAFVDVRHAHGGGEILLGRDGRGANAQRVDIDQGVQLRADATVSGNGGRVVAWSDDRLTYRGAISARGAGAGSGGSVEVAAARRLVFEGTVDVGNGDGSPLPRGGALPQVPRSGQPQAVQAALVRTENEAVELAAQAAAALRSPDALPPGRYKRRVVVDAAQCRTE